MLGFLKGRPEHPRIGQIRQLHLFATLGPRELRVIDGFLHAATRLTVNVSNLDRRFDEVVIDGLVNLVGNVTYRTGSMLKVVQTGSMRNYVTFIAVGLLGIFVLLLALFPAGS